jgi:FMN phosphatase YigB (HAD superfamily)
VGSGINVQSPESLGRYRTKLVITDVDNTFYDFGAYFEAGLQALIPEVARQLQISTDAAIASLRAVYQKFGSIEYPFAIEEFQELKPLPLERRRAIVERTTAAFWESGRAALIAYPSVAETLAHLRRERVPVVAFTDAPVHEATRRVGALNLDKYLSGLVATEWFPRRKAATRVLRVDEVPGFVRVPRRLTVVGRLAGEQRKPNAQTYERIAAAFGLNPVDVTVIGDSPRRDLAPAASLGMTAVWARYGERHPEREDLLQQVVPTRLPEIDASQASAASAFPAVDRFEELLKYLPTQQVLPWGPNDE